MLPDGQKIRYQHCPVCESAQQVRAWPINRTQSRPLAAIIDCPQCTSTAGLWRVLDGRRSA
jgi:hypothetical protein